MLMFCLEDWGAGPPEPPLSTPLLRQQQQGDKQQRSSNELCLMETTLYVMSVRHLSKRGKLIAG